MKRFLKSMKARNVIALLLAVFMMIGVVPIESAYAAGNAITQSDFLRADGLNLKNQNGKIVNLRGTNAGGYLLQEFWMTPTKDTDNVHDETTIYKVLTERFGEEEMMELIKTYQDSYWTEADFDNCAEMGMNVIRLPFWWRNLMDANGELYDNAFDRIDWFVEEAGERGMYVILDMHGAPGSQNGSDHSGVDGGNNKETASEFFFGANAEKNQELYYQLWATIAEHYKDNPTVAGYDLLNEPYCTYRYDSALGENGLHELLWGIYDKAYDTVRAIDDGHVIIMEATWDPNDLPDPDDYGWENVMYEYHNYLYDDYDNVNGQQISNMLSKLSSIANTGYNVPSYMGEFSYFNQPSAWDEGLALLNEWGINWTTWTYKTVAGYGMWGLYHHPEEFDENKINLETAEFDEIKAFYTRMGESEENTDLTNVVKKNYNAATQESQLTPILADVEEGIYYLKGFNCGKMLTANDEANGLIAATDTGIKETDIQKFELIKNDDDTVSLKSLANGKYVSLGTDNALYAAADEITNNEEFLMVQVTDTTVGFRSVANNKFACADEDLAKKPEYEGLGIPVIARSDAAGWWETFYLYDEDQKLIGGSTTVGFSGWFCQEAENANIVGGKITADNPDNFSNGQAVADLGTDKSISEIERDWSNINYVSFDVEVDKAGAYQMVIRYNGDDDKTIAVKVNDGETQEVSLPNVLPGHNWDVMHDKYITVDLEAGSNTVYVSGVLEGTNWMNLDRIDICKQPIQEVEIDGKTYQRYEAEGFYTTGGLESQGFYSNGVGVGSMNVSTEFENIDDGWTNVKYVDYTLYAEEAGEYQVVLHYNGDGSDGMSVAYKVNDGENQKLILDNGGKAWNDMNTVTFTVELEEGFNDLKISGTIEVQSNWANDDCIDVLYLGTNVEPDTTEPDTTEPDTTEPDTTEPDTTEPDTTEPDTTEPDTTEPDTTEPDTTEPDTTEPDTTEPDDGQPTDFPDVTANNPYGDNGQVLIDAVNWGTHAGIVEGIDGLFMANKTITRAEMVEFLYRAYKDFDLPDVEGAPESFKDVPAEGECWYRDAALWAAKKGITQGTGGGKFSPDKVCTRAEVFTMLYRANGAPIQTGRSIFNDVTNTKDFYYDAVVWATNEKYTEGIGGGKFGPNVPCNRGMVVVTLYRVFGE